MKKILNGRYEIIEEIGSGGMAYVYKAKCNVLNRFVGVKVLKEEFVNDQDFVDKFKQESMSAARLNHKNIVNVYDTGIDEGVYYIVMELVEGISLNELIKQEEKLSIEQSIDIVIQICEALSHAHGNGLIHRDIKPHNILIDKNNQVKVADFGIARAVTNKTMTNNDNTMGSVNYFSPEQARGGYIDEKSDIYSLGIVFYEMLTGQLPFKGESPISVALKHVNEFVPAPSVVNNNIPPYIDEVVSKCTNKKQSLRYDSVDQIIFDLRKIKGNRDIYTGWNDRSEDKEKSEALSRFLSESSYSNSKDTEHRRESKSKDRIKKKKKENLVEDASKDENSKESPAGFNLIKTMKNDGMTEKMKYSVLAVIAALAVTIILSIGAMNFIRGYLTVPEVEVPDLIGVDKETAQNTIEDLGLKFVVKDTMHSDEFEEGIVMNQNMRVGEKLKEGFPIEVIISLGERLVSVPDIVHKYSNEAMVLLNENGLISGEVTYEFSDTVPWGLVIRQSPSADSTIRAGEEVDYVLSKGQEVEYVMMPNVVGRSLSEAETLLQSRGFQLGEVTYRPSEEIQEDLVSYQSHPASTEVEQGTTISLVISTGPEEQEEPGEPDENGQGDNGTPGTGYAQLIINLPDEEGQLSIFVERILEDQRQVVYQETHYKEDDPLVINLEGFGVQKFEIFINSDFYGIEEINFGD